GETVPHFYHLFVCTGPDCRQDGAEDTLLALQKSLQEKNIEKRVRVTLCLCLGQCGNGPNMVLYPEGIWYGRLDEREIDGLVQKHLIEGKPLSHLVRVPSD
ncbi:MAG: ferredoxin, partial [Nitrospiria bacterium]